MDNFEYELKKIKAYLEKRNIPYYIHAGCGLFLHGIKGELDDCDIRIFHSDLEYILADLQKELDGKFETNYNKEYSKGIYGGVCIYYNGLAKFDFCCDMVNISDLGEFVFPLELQTFKDSEIKKFNSLELPVSSLENLLLYYLILRRGEIDGKNDELHIKEILSHDKFDLDKFKSNIENHPKRKEIIELLEERLN